MAEHGRLECDLHISGYTLARLARGRLNSWILHAEIALLPVVRGCWLDRCSVGHCLRSIVCKPEGVRGKASCAAQRSFQHEGIFMACRRGRPVDLVRERAKLVCVALQPHLRDTCAFHHRPEKHVDVLLANGRHHYVRTKADVWVVGVSCEPGSFTERVLHKNRVAHKLSAWSFHLDEHRFGCGKGDADLDNNKLASLHAGEGRLHKGVAFMVCVDAETVLPLQAWGQVEGADALRWIDPLRCAATWDWVDEVNLYIELLRLAQPVLDGHRLGVMLFARHLDVQLLVHFWLQRSALE
mmetsp:Transcript_59354/g.138256  ORF Transcript_59354/g.138256 Transcript_59354/m.138256 type:complete len:297 (-) Transcript_59354:951-1841(-)